ncbi:hypothetical protein [uncultured Gammaproteobacteria bacterium]|nr:hypothetical protein [uncultured Gammaproteobacteria bacterium]
MNKVFISGFGHFFPGEAIDTQRLNALIPNYDIKMIEDFFGVKTRHYISISKTVEKSELNTTNMAAIAANMAIKDAKIELDDIDVLITNSTTPDERLPNLATLLQKKLQLKNVMTLDLRGGCSASMQSMMIADIMIQSNNAKTVLLVGSEFTSQFYLKRLLNKNNPKMEDVVNGCLFADGSGALVVQSSDLLKDRLGRLPRVNYSNSKSCFYDEPYGFSVSTAKEKESKHSHRAIRKTLPKVMSRAYADLLQGSGKHIRDYDLIVIPQVNQSMINLMSNNGVNSKLNNNKICYYGNETGNVPAAAMFSAISMAKHRGRFLDVDSIGVVSIETASWNYAVADLVMEDVQ